MHMLNMLNENAQVLDFQRFDLFSKSFSIHLASFKQSLNSLIFNALLTSIKYLIFNDLSILNGAGGWVKGRVLSKG